MTDLCEQKLINALLEVERLNAANSSLARRLAQATIFNDGLTRRIERLEVDMARITSAAPPPG